MRDRLRTYSNLCLLLCLFLLLLATYLSPFPSRPSDRVPAWVEDLDLVNATPILVGLSVACAMLAISMSIWRSRIPRS